MEIFALYVMLYYGNTSHTLGPVRNFYNTIEQCTSAADDIRAKSVSKSDIYDTSRVITFCVKR